MVLEGISQRLVIDASKLSYLSLLWMLEWMCIFQMVVWIEVLKK